MIELGKNIVTDFEESTKREWLETNGIGGYASGTISGANTRRYQGLLVAAAKPPLGRLVMLSKYDETVVIDGERFEIFDADLPHAPRGCAAQAWSVAELLRVLEPLESNKITGII